MNTNAVSAVAPTASTTAPFSVIGVGESALSEFSRAALKRMRDLSDKILEFIQCDTWDGKRSMLMTVGDDCMENPKITDEVLRDLANIVAFVSQGGEVAEMLYNDVVIPAFYRKYCSDDQRGVINAYNLLTAAFCSFLILMGGDDVSLIVEYIRRKISSREDMYRYFNSTAIVALKANRKHIKEKDSTINEYTICYPAFNALKLGESVEGAFKILKDDLSKEGCAAPLMNYAYNAKIHLIPIIKSFYFTLFKADEKKRSGVNAKSITHVLFYNSYLAQRVVEEALEWYKEELLKRMEAIVGSLVYGYNMKGNEEAMDKAVILLVRVMKAIFDRVK